MAGNLAVARTRDGGAYVTAHPCGEPVPAQSDLNVPGPGPTSNRFIGAADSQGRLCFVSSHLAQMVVDVNATVEGAQPFPNRRTDTRERASAPPCAGAQLTALAAPGAAVSGNTRLDVTITNIGATCSLPGHPAALGVATTARTAPIRAAPGTFFGKPRPVSTIATGETLVGVLNGSTTCAPYSAGTRERWSALDLTFVAGPTIRVANSLDTTCGLRVSAFGIGPIAPPPGTQRRFGDGWRLLTDERDLDMPFASQYVIEVAVTPARYSALFRRVGFTEPRPDVDFGTEVVVYVYETYSSTCPLLLDDVRIDVERATVTPQFVFQTPPELVQGCTPDASPHAFLFTVQRVHLPPTPFFVVRSNDCRFGCATYTVARL